MRLRRKEEEQPEGTVVRMLRPVLGVSQRERGKIEQIRREVESYLDKVKGKTEMAQPSDEDQGQ